MRVVLYISGHKTVQNGKLIVEAIPLKSLFLLQGPGTTTFDAGKLTTQVPCTGILYCIGIYQRPVSWYMYGTAPVQNVLLNLFLFAGKSMPKAQQTMQGPILDVCWHDDGSKVT